MTAEQINELLKTHKTPLYVFDLNELRERVNFLKKSLPQRVKLCYAVKANTFISKEMSAIADWLELCSPGEYRICKKLGVPASKFVISGVNKSEKVTQEMIKNTEDMGCYTAESVNQFHILYEGAKKAERKIPVLLRLTSGNQFGLDEADLERIIAEYKDSEYVDICGIQFFSGTQKTSLKKLQREINYVDGFITGLKDKYSFNTEKLEFGGGFPVSYFEGESFDEDEYLKAFSEMLKNMDYQGEIVLELGRSIAASCGTYLTRVADIKQNHSENYAIVDGGMHQIVYFGQFMAMKHPKIKLFPEREDENKEEWNICGSLCTVNDILVKRLPLSNLQIGDVLVFTQTGAYCATEGISLFLTRELPEVVLLGTDSKFTTVRKPTETELFNTPNNIL